MAYFIQLIFAGVALGCIYALIGLGFSIIFKASDVINFAQGELLLVGAYVVSSGVFEWHLPFLAAFLLGIVVTVLIGVLFQRFILQHMIGRPVFSILMITIGLDIILRTLVLVRWGSKSHSCRLALQSHERHRPLWRPFRRERHMDDYRYHRGMHCALHLFSFHEVWTLHASNRA